MDTSGLEKFIEKEIEDYLIEELDVDTVNEIADHIDNRFLARRITEKLADRILTFKNNLIMDGEVCCPRCYRPHGNWMGRFNGSLSESDLMRDGKTIIVVDDF